MVSIIITCFKTYLKCESMIETSITYGIFISNLSQPENKMNRFNVIYVRFAREALSILTKWIWCYTINNIISP